MCTRCATLHTPCFNALAEIQDFLVPKTICPGVPRTLQGAAAAAAAVMCHGITSRQLHFGPVTVAELCLFFARQAWRWLAARI